MISFFFRYYQTMNVIKHHQEKSNDSKSHLEVGRAQKNTIAWWIIAGKNIQFALIFDLSIFWILTVGVNVEERWEEEPKSASANGSDELEDDVDAGNDHRSDDDDVVVGDGGSVVIHILHILVGKAVFIFCALFRVTFLYILGGSESWAVFGHSVVSQLNGFP